MGQNLAYIHPDAKIGKDVTIEPFAYIAGDVEIGDGTWIGPNATILDGARIGKKCRVFPGAVISAIPQDLKFRGEITTAEIGDNTTMRECVTINRGTSSKGKTVIGSNCLLMAYVHIGHDCRLGNSIILGNGTQLAGEVEIDDMAIVSAHALVHQFERIGSHVMVQGGSKVNKDIPPFIIAAREPITFAGINIIGLRRRGFDANKVAEIQEIYRNLYGKGMNVSQAVAYIEANMAQTEERDLILSFIKGSKRGIVREFTGADPSEGIED
ncbi:MAG: acyl-ACP--UDP-N-acetylglucosamine O-acyltransferase [Bacteroidales bacterium]|nr:MAG: acyl-ACP--UDP-N-acetylglucosamine O-acyltransferase [Bacteroidales bacterium]